MTQPTVTCGRCAAQNIAGDQFCGSCGAFLEFVAEQGAAVTPAGANPLPADPSLATSVPLDGGLAGLKAGAGGPAPARAPSPPAGGGPARFTLCPLMVIRVMTIPSVTSDGTHVAAWGVLPRKMLGSSRSWICASESGLLLCSVTVSCPVMRDVVASSRALIV